MVQLMPSPPHKCDIRMYCGKAKPLCSLFNKLNTRLIWLTMLPGSFWLFNMIYVSPSLCRPSPHVEVLQIWSVSTLYQNRSPQILQIIWLSNMPQYTSSHHADISETMLYIVSQQQLISKCKKLWSRQTTGEFGNLAESHFKTKTVLLGMGFLL